MRVPNTRRGFSLIEVLIAVTILSGVVLTMAMNTTKSSRNVTSSGTRSRAQALLDQQIARARIWPTYSTLSQLTAARYNVASNGLTPSTVIAVDSTSGKNLTTVTVTVSGSTNVLPVAMIRSISIAAP
ncbi:MAG: prepilin-type N-terminal cleavage/methylation domain-containing protein [Gemmatimonadaceae bacterium]